MLAALEDVNFVVINENETAVSIIEALSPDVFVRGADYAMPLASELAAEQAAMERCGGRMVFSDGATESSTNTLNAFLSN
jgi:bifunctional ADP-heptose synthase (sugar kinase/adenylyltransferase)